MKKSGRKWKTKECGRCLKSHDGYSGKLDSMGIEYVVCGNTNKRMNVSGTGWEGHSFAFQTLWEEQKIVDLSFLNGRKLPKIDPKDILGEEE